MKNGIFSLCNLKEIRYLSGTAYLNYSNRYFITFYGSPISMRIPQWTYILKHFFWDLVLLLHNWIIKNCYNVEVKRISWSFLFRLLNKVILYILGLGFVCMCNTSFDKTLSLNVTMWLYLTFLSCWGCFRECSTVNLWSTIALS